MSSIELKPCPFCGGTNVGLQETEDSEDETMWYVYCAWCGGCAGCKYSKKEAIANWNDRWEDEP